MLSNIVSFYSLICLGKFHSKHFFEHLSLTGSVLSSECRSEVLARISNHYSGDRGVVVRNV